MSTDTHATPNLLDRIRMNRARLDALHRAEGEVARLERAHERALVEAEQTRLLTLLGAMCFDALEAGPSRIRSLLGELAPTRFPTDSTPAPRERPSPAPAAPVAATMGAAAVTIDASTLAALEDRLRENQGSRADGDDAVTFVPAAPMSNEQHRLLHSIIDELGPNPSNLRGAGPARREADHLAALVGRTLDAWYTLDDVTHRTLIDLVVARLRAVQVAIQRHLSSAQRFELAGSVDKQLRRLTLHAATARPGSTHGLAAKHKPQTGDWSSDADRAARSLAARLAPTPLDRPVSAPPRAECHAGANDAIRRLRKELKAGLEGPDFIGALWLLLHDHALSQRDPRIVGLATAALGADPDGLLASAGLADLAREVRKRDDEEADEEADEVPTWPHRELTRGWRAVIVGGDRRPERETAIQKALGLQSLRWVPTDKGFRHVDALTESIAAGSVDLVIVLQRFVSHSITDRLFALRSGGRRVVLATSYGVRAVQEGLERFMGIRSAVATSHAG